MQLKSSLLNPLGIELPIIRSRYKQNYHGDIKNQVDTRASDFSSLWVLTVPNRHRIPRVLDPSTRCEEGTEDANTMACGGTYQNSCRDLWTLCDTDTGTKAKDRKLAKDASKSRCNNEPYTDIPSSLVFKLNFTSPSPYHKLFIFINLPHIYTKTISNLTTPQQAKPSHPKKKKKKKKNSAHLFQRRNWWTAADGDHVQAPLK